MRGSGVGDTGPLTTGPAGSTGGAGETGLPQTGDDLPPPDFNTCECRAEPSPSGRLWWLMVAFGAVARRRRAA